MAAFHALLAWARANPGLVTGLWALSVASFFGTLLAIPVMVVRMPEDYFLYDRAHLREYRRQHPVFRLFSVVLKNILGVAFILAGIIMLFLPGQGVLTILIGITLVSFPRKRALELRLVRKPSVLRALNWMRERGHKPPLRLP
jgi:archaellum biogenesis protein FlaJ (TadC family)